MTGRGVACVMLSWQRETCGRSGAGSVRQRRTRTARRVRRRCPAVVEISPHADGADRQTSPMNGTFLPVSRLAVPDLRRASGGPITNPTGMSEADLVVRSEPSVTCSGNGFLDLLLLRPTMSASPALPSVPALLTKHLPHAPDAGWYLQNEIPAKKLKNAIRTYAGDVAPDSVLALGDGTVFGSAKEGVLVTADMLHSKTTDGRFSIPLSSVVRAKRIGGWPNYTIEISCTDATSHRISMTCFEKNQDQLINFLNSFSSAAEEAGAEQAAADAEAANRQAKDEPAILRMHPRVEDTSIRAVNAGLRLAGVCAHDRFDETGDLFSAAFQSDIEVPLLKGYCQYVGFNGRQVDGLFLLSNRRLQLFSLESGPKIFVVEMTRRLLDAVPVPFFDDIVGFFLFSIPRYLYLAVRGGHEKLICQALATDNSKLLSGQPPLRRVQETKLSELSSRVSQVTVGTGVWTGILSREFGVSFAPVNLAGVFSVPKDLILPAHETLEPVSRLLYAVRDVLAQHGLGCQLNEKEDQLTIFPAAETQQSAA